jgi:hypothetical protein
MANASVQHLINQSTLDRAIKNALDIDRCLGNDYMLQKTTDAAEYLNLVAGLYDFDGEEMDAPSSRHSGLMYHVTVKTCTCPAYPRWLCKHRVALKLLLSAAELASPTPNAIMQKSVAETPVTITTYQVIDVMENAIIAEYPTQQEANAVCDAHAAKTHHPTMVAATGYTEYTSVAETPAVLAAYEAYDQFGDEPIVPAICDGCKCYLAAGEFNYCWRCVERRAEELFA